MRGNWELPGSCCRFGLRACRALGRGGTGHSENVEIVLQELATWQVEARAAMDELHKNLFMKRQTVVDYVQTYTGPSTQEEAMHELAQMSAFALGLNASEAEALAKEHLVLGTRCSNEVGNSMLYEWSFAPASFWCGQSESQTVISVAKSILGRGFDCTETLTARDLGGEMASLRFGNGQKRLIAVRIVHLA